VIKFIALALPLALGLGGSAAALAESEPSEATEVVCRRMPPPTSSRLGSRNICKTKADWEALREQSRREVQQQQDRGHFSQGN